MIKYKKYIIYFICSVLIWTLLSSLSILYNPFLSFDESVYICIGRALNNGKIMYADIYDTKGPIWYILCHLIVKIPINPIYTWFIFDCIINFCIIVMFDKILSIKKETNFILPIALNIGIFTIVSKFPDCSEYKTLPIQLYIVYTIIDTLEQNKSLQKKKLYIIGLLFGILFFIKYTLIITPFTFLVYYFIKQRLKSLLYVIYGGLSICCMVILKLIVENSFTDYINVQKSIIFNHTVHNLQRQSVLFIIILFVLIFFYLCIELIWRQNIYRLLLIVNVIIILLINPVIYYLIPLYIFLPVFYYDIDTFNIKQKLLIVSLVIINLIWSFYYIQKISLLEDKFLYYIYNQISSYDSIYVTQLPQYYAYANKELPLYFDYYASEDDFNNEISNAINSNQYEYLFITKYYKKDIPKNYKEIKNYYNEYTLYQKE